MRTPALIAGTALLAACSAQPPAANEASATAVNGTEEVAMSESDAIPTNETAMAAAMADVPTGAATTPADARYLGRWVGVEGMYLNVTTRPGGGVALDMQWDLDNTGKFDGIVTAEGIRFTRNGVAETLTRTDGEATGLKYLAGKRDCLTVRSGEGYCRS